VNELTDKFNSKISNIIDSIAPTKVKVISGKKKSPWTKKVKKECRKAERRLRKTNLQVLYNIYKEKLRNYSSKLKNARQSCFSDHQQKQK